MTLLQPKAARFSIALSGRLFYPLALRACALERYGAQAGEGRGEGVNMTESENPWLPTLMQFEKALSLLQHTAAIEEPTVAERAGLVHFFELAFNLSLELLIVHADAHGFVVTTPRDAVRRACEAGIVSEEDGWIEALQDRKLSRQIFDERIAIELDQKIRMKYFPLLQQLQQCLR